MAKKKAIPTNKALYSRVKAEAKRKFNGLAKDQKGIGLT